MTEKLYTQKREAQWRGPTTSNDTNARIEENYQDLTLIKNQISELANTIDYLKRYMVKNSLVYNSALNTSASELINSYVESTATTIPIFIGINSALDNSRFNDTDFEINAIDACDYDPTYRITTLPTIKKQSFSKLKYYNEAENEYVSPNFKVFIEPIGDVEEEFDNNIDNNGFKNCLTSDTNFIGWELNSIVAEDSNLLNASAFRVHIAIPNELSLNRDSNTILLKPYLLNSMNISKFQYTTVNNVTFTNQDSWADFEVPQHPASGVDQNVLPQDTPLENIWNSKFCFPPMPITGVRFEISTDEVFSDSGLSVFTQGLQKFDIRYEKYLSEGKFIVRVPDPPENLQSVEPVLANCRSADVPNSFNYRFIWETSPGSGIYTLESVSNAQDVWIEITLSKTPNGATPVLPYFFLKYS